MTLFSKQKVSFVSLVALLLSAFFFASCSSGDDDGSSFIPLPVVPVPVGVASGAAFTESCNIAFPFALDTNEVKAGQDITGWMVPKFDDAARAAESETVIESLTVKIKTIISETIISVEISGKAPAKTGTMSLSVQVPKEKTKDKKDVSIVKNVWSKSVVSTKPAEEKPVEKPEEKTGYTVTISTMEHGSVTASKTSGIQAAEKITLTVAAAEGYDLSTIEAVKGETKLQLTKNDTGLIYTFEMPEGSVTVSATFKQKGESPVPAESYDFTAEELTSLSAAIKDALKTLKEGATAFKPSATAPAAGTETITIYEKYKQVFWKDGTVVYYYSPYGYKISLGNNCQDMFHGSAFEEIDLSGFDTRSVTTMKWMFSECRKLKTLNISSFDTSKVTDMVCMFKLCQSLASLDVSNFNTSNVTNMGGMFSDCEKLEELNITNFDTSKVTNMSNMFDSCKKLKIINLSSFNTGNVTDMSYMFYLCASIQELNLASFKFTEDTDISSMFNGCTSLKTIYCAAGTGLAIKAATTYGHSKDVFLDCKSIKGGREYTYNPTYISGVYARIDGGFGSKTFGYFTESEVSSDDPDLQSAQIKAALKALDLNNATAFKPASEAPKAGTPTQVVNKQRNQVFWKDGTVIYYYSPDGSKISLGSDASELFWGCKSIKVIDLSGFDTSNVKTMKKMFCNCRALEELDLSTFDTKNVTDMSEMFKECIVMQKLNISSFDTSNVTDMSSMFYKCGVLLEEVDLSSFNTSKVTTMKGMFGYSSFKKIDVSKFDTSNVTDMAYMFEHCNTVSLDVSNFDTSKVEDMSFMFGYCTKLTKLDVSKFNTGNVTLMRMMFSSCESLTELVLSESFKVAKVTDMSDMFFNCKALTKLDVSKFYTFKAETMQNMFKGCSSLTELNVDNFQLTRETNIMSLFEGCSKLKTIYGNKWWSTIYVKKENELTILRNSNVFKDCTSLVGGAGTKYIATQVDTKYAGPDQGANAPGYFTAKK